MLAMLQAQVMLSEIYPGASPKIGSTYWDQILEVGIISVSRRVLKRLHEFLEQVSSLTRSTVITSKMCLDHT
jgi:zinc finger FYVE domain-containing protein 26